MKRLVLIFSVLATRALTAQDFQTDSQASGKPHFLHASRLESRRQAGFSLDRCSVDRPQQGLRGSYRIANYLNCLHSRPPGSRLMVGGRTGCA